jgi:hypothetical protein
MRSCALASFVVVIAFAACSGCAIGGLGAVIGATLDRGPYSDGSIARELGPRAARKVGCLELGFALYADARSELVDLHVGNTCAKRQAFDMRRAALRGRDLRGEAVAAALSDPRDEVELVHVGGYERGRARFRVERARPLAGLCLDVSGVAPEAPRARVEPVCLGEEGVW